MPEFVNKIVNRTKTLVDKLMSVYNYCVTGVWTDYHNTFKVRLVKTLNLSVRSFLSADLQVRACSLTYKLVLAVVPALALLFAIGRGFGFQNIIANQMLDILPAQRQEYETVFGFVDSYLAQSSEGIFVGVGVAFLLWTMLSLLSDVENAFNVIWNVKQGRSMWRKVTDYTAILILLPILMICSSGITVFMSTAIQHLLPFDFMTPVVSFMFDALSLVLVWLFFAGAYMLIPNTHVKFGNAMLSGVLAGTAFMILQWLFVSGQLYVTRYNAIYGSFAFLPLMMIWLQLVWMITLSGAVVCYSAQNIIYYNFNNEISTISTNYKRRILLAVCSIAVDRFVKHQDAPTADDIAREYQMPVLLIKNAAQILADANVLRFVNEKTGHYRIVDALVPAYPPSEMTVAKVIKAVDGNGAQNFLETFDKEFIGLSRLFDKMYDDFEKATDDLLISDINISRTTAEGDTK